MTNEGASPHGFNSLLLGALAIVLMLAANYAESVRGAGSGYLLQKADELGLIRKSVPMVAEMRAPPPFSVTDERAIIAAKGFAIYLAIASLLLAVFGEYWRESNLYLSAGFITGASALVLSNFYAGLSAMVLGAVALLLVRGRNEA